MHGCVGSQQTLERPEQAEERREAVSAQVRVVPVKLLGPVETMCKAAVTKYRAKEQRGVPVLVSSVPSVCFAAAYDVFVADL
jgi:hypothetical protein